MTERCQSGLMCTLGKRVYGNVSEVRILSSPPKQKTPQRVFFILSCYFIFLIILHTIDPQKVIGAKAISVAR